jgi:hypothetical protein
MNEHLRETLITWIIRIGLVTVTLLSAYGLMYGN